MTKKIVIITGVSGTGKSELSRQLAATLNFAKIGMSEFFRKIAKARGYESLEEFNKRAGFKAAYFDLIPSFISEIGQQMKGKQGIVIDGIYDPFLYEEIKNHFRNCHTHLFNIYARKRERLRWLTKRAGKREQIKAIKRTRDRTKRIFGVNAMMTHKDASTMRISSMSKAVKQVIETISKPPREQATARLKARHKKLRKRAEKTQKLMKKKTIRF